MFNTTGEVHHGGIDNEMFVIDLLNNKGVYDLPVTHLGGTQNKADAVSGDLGISIKRKKDINKGSYDYLNSTVPVSLLPNASDFDAVKDLANTCNAKETVSELFLKTSSSILDKIDPDTMTGIVSDAFVKQADMDIVITDVKTKKVYIMSANDLQVPTLIRDGYKATIVPTKKLATSRKLVFVKGNDKVDTGLRVRLVTNNGIGAMMGLSKANKTSSVVVKLQQDKVSKMISNTKHEVISY